ncbi:protein jagged-1b isoform X2 [Chiloscyllium plagiosum]|uniref:protein jagged-1b isoform X2 n=1 Tax=Chiloscyllium plagiosum TaxID=36176 RepID=UPI001CB8385C|nr:protein jagged-1b isoform X2 [Chiloscyllium plagiosum]
MCLSGLKNLTVIVMFILIPKPEIPHAAGTFELQIILMQNHNGELHSGICCDGERETPHSRCTQDECDTRFHVCLKHYQVWVLPGGPCILGTGSSSILGGNSFSFKSKNSDENAGSIRVPFRFAWPRSYSLILEAWDYDNNSANDAGTQQLIERVIHSGMINPGEQWQHQRHQGRIARIDYNVRVLCDENYYGLGCNKLCRPRNDFFGHYMCDSVGNKVCVEGWIGPQCAQAVCKQGCHETRGYCEVPEECKCHYGWQGVLCSMCIPFPGCIHGTCSEPWQCDCETNWGGILCDKDLNYCGTHQPCQNGGTCENAEPNEYQCICSEGFGGQNCDVRTSDCSTSCQNGGICQKYQCNCPGGYTGNYCETRAERCSSSPCLNGAHCVHTVNGFYCQCLPGFSGRHCEVIAGQCHINLCQHGATCYSMQHGYFCSCPDGYEGRTFHLLFVLMAVMVFVIVSVCIYLFMKQWKRKESEQIPSNEHVNNQRVSLNLIQNLPRSCSIERNPEYGYKTLCAAKRSVCITEQLTTDQKLEFIILDIRKDIETVSGNGSNLKRLN